MEFSSLTDVHTTSLHSASGTLNWPRFACASRVKPLPLHAYANHSFKPTGVSSSARRVMSHFTSIKPLVPSEPLSRGRAACYLLTMYAWVRPRSPLGRALSPSDGSISSSSSRSHGSRLVCSYSTASSVQAARSSQPASRSNPGNVCTQLRSQPLAFVPFRPFFRRTCLVLLHVCAPASAAAA